MTDADKERSPKDESKRLLKVAATCRGHYPRKRHKYKEPLIGLMKGSESGGYLLSHKCSTIGVAELNDPVRNGKGWDLSAITT